MKKILAFTLLVCILALSLAACALSGEVTVTYVLGNGAENITESAPMLVPHSAPPDPVRENYIFAGWYRDSSLTQPHLFSEPLRTSITLYAAWIPNYEKLSAAVSAYVLDACVTVKVTHLKAVGLMLTPAKSSSGSGFCVKEALGYTYILTNSHVIALEEGCDDRLFVVTDAYGREYEAVLVHDSPERDLACLKIITPKEKLATLEISEEKFDKSQPVIAIGTPQGKPNVVTFGKIENFKKIEVTDGEDYIPVDFSVIWHTAYVDHGSSGGALLDTSLKVVGVNFATSTGNDGKFAFGFALDAKTVLSFLNEAYAK